MHVGTTAAKVKLVAFTVRSADSVNFAVSPAFGAPEDGDQFAASFQLPAAPLPVQVYSTAPAHDAHSAANNQVNFLFFGIVQLLH